MDSQKNPLRMMSNRIQEKGKAPEYVACHMTEDIFYSTRDIYREKGRVRGSRDDHVQDQR